MQARYQLGALAACTALLVAAAAGGEGLVTPAQREIAASRAAIERQPGQASGYVELAAGLARRARETHDPRHYDEAEKALDKASRFAPESLEVEKTRIRVLLGRHEFARARDRAKALNARPPTTCWSTAI